MVYRREAERAAEVENIANCCLPFFSVIKQYLISRSYVNDERLPFYYTNNQDWLSGLPMPPLRRVANGVDVENPRVRWGAAVSWRDDGAKVAVCCFCPLCLEILYGSTSHEIVNKSRTSCWQNFPLY